MGSTNDNIEIVLPLVLSVGQNGENKEQNGAGGKCLQLESSLKRVGMLCTFVKLSC